MGLSCRFVAIAVAVIVTAGNDDDAADASVVLWYCCCVYLTFVCVPLFQDASAIVPAHLPRVGRLRLQRRPLLLPDAPGTGGGRVVHRGRGRGRRVEHRQQVLQGQDQDAGVCGGEDDKEQQKQALILQLTPPF